MNTRLPNTLLMDMGNVLIKVTPEVLEDYFRQHGAPVTTETKQDFMNILNAYEQGDFSSEIFLEKSCALAGLGPEKAFSFDEVWKQVVPANSEIAVTMDACRRLKKQGVRMALFSNTNELHIRHIEQIYPDLLPLFDHIILSYEVGGEKPDPPMYRYVIEKLGMIPEETLYFDDRADNIAAGLAFGFQAHQFDYNRPETFLDALPPKWRQ